MENRCIMEPLYPPKGVYNGKTCIMEPLYTCLAPKGVYNGKTCIMELLYTSFEILDTIANHTHPLKAATYYSKHSLT